MDSMIFDVSTNLWSYVSNFWIWKFAYNFSLKPNLILSVLALQLEMTNCKYLKNETVEIVVLIFRLIFGSEPWSYECLRFVMIHWGVLGWLHVGYMFSRGRFALLPCMCWCMHVHNITPWQEVENKVSGCL